MKRLMWSAVLFAWVGQTAQVSAQAMPTVGPWKFGPAEFFGTADEPKKEDRPSLESWCSSLCTPFASCRGNHSGVDPSDFRRCFTLYNDYNRLDSGNTRNTTFANFKFPIFEKADGGFAGAAFVELPFNYYDLDTPVVPGIGGLGDVKAGFRVVPLENAYVKFLIGTDLYIPSADNVLLNVDPTTNLDTISDLPTGKYRAAPMAGFVFNVTPQLLFAPLYFHEFSFAGNAARADIHRGTFRFFGLYSVTDQFYLAPEVQVLIDYNNGSDVDFFLRQEFGLVLGRTTLYVKPGWGMNPDTNNKHWGIEAGIRVPF